MTLARAVRVAGLCFLLAAPSSGQTTLDACTICVCHLTSVNCANTNPWASATPVQMYFPVTTTQLGLAETQLPFLSSDYVKLGDLFDLTELVVVDNVIPTLENGALNGLPKLTTFKMAGNKLKTIKRAAFSFVVELTELDLSDNELMGLASTVFADLVDLKILRLNNNHLAGLESGVFKSNTKLTELYLHRNDLTSDGSTGLKPTAFTNLASVSILHLNDNKLLAVTDGLFAPLTNLDELHLEGNSISDVDDAAFVANKQLTQLYLQRNKLTALSNTVVASVSSVSSLYIEGSYWDCCLMGWAVASSSVKDKSLTTCARPAVVSGINLKDSRAVSVAAKSSSDSSCVSSAPSTPGKMDSTAATSTSLTVEWQAVSGNAFNVDYYRVEYVKVGDTSGFWRTATCPTGRLPPLPDALSANADCQIIVSAKDITNERSLYSLTIVSLAKDTAYYSRVAAHSPLLGTAADGGTWSQVGPGTTAFRTLEDVPSEASLPKLNSTSASTIVASWNAPASPNGIITKYDIMYTQANVTAWTTRSTSLRSYTITGLLPFIPYHVKVVAHTKVGSGPASAVASATTLQKAPEKVVNAPAEGAVLASSFTVEWDPVGATDANGVITGYTVYVSQSSRRGRRAITGTGYASGSQTKRLIAGVAPATTYRITITASTSGGESLPSPVLIVRTLDAAPTQPDAPVMKALTAKAILAEWAVPNVTNGDIAAYVLEYTKVVANVNVSNATASVASALNISSFRLDALVDGLEPATKYKVRVQAWTRLAGSVFSEYATISTKDDLPSAVACAATAVSDTEVDVSWSPPSQTNGRILGYQVWVTSKVRIVSGYTPVQEMADVVVYNATGSELKFRHSSLDPYTRYTYSVRGFTQAGYSALAQQASAKTRQAIPAGQSPPTVRLIGTTKAEIIWSKPAYPNGEIIKFELHKTQDDNEVPSYSGKPTTNPSINDGKFTINITDLAPDTTYEFTVTAHTAIGPSTRSFRTVVKSGNTTPSATVATLVATLCIFVIVLSLGFMWEHRRGKRRGDARAISPDELPRNASSFLSEKQDMANIFAVNPHQFNGNNGLPPPGGAPGLPAPGLAQVPRKAERDDDSDSDSDSDSEASKA